MRDIWLVNYGIFIRIAKNYKLLLVDEVLALKRIGIKKKKFDFVLGEAENVQNV